MRREYTRRESSLVEEAWNAHLVGPVEKDENSPIDERESAGDAAELP
jgi:hypothetical protein